MTAISEEHVGRRGRQTYFHVVYQLLKRTQTDTYAIRLILGRCSSDLGNSLNTLTAQSHWLAHAAPLHVWVEPSPKHKHDFMQRKSAWMIDWFTWDKQIVSTLYSKDSITNERTIKQCFVARAQSRAYFTFVMCVVSSVHSIGCVSECLVFWNFLNRQTAGSLFQYTQPPHSLRGNRNPNVFWLRMLGNGEMGPYSAASFICTGHGAEILQ